jgi:hypothetical protein
MDGRRRSAIALVATVLAIGYAPAFARGGGHSGVSHSTSVGGGHHTSSSQAASGHGTAAEHPAAAGTGHSSEATTHSPPTTTAHAGSSRASPGVQRDSHGRIARSTKAKDEFKKSHPCPSTGRPSGACPGYVIDHVQALKHGGADSPGNMQWQTKAEAKAKDRVE